MLKLNHLSGFGVGGGGKTLMQLLTDLGSTANLDFVVDAGDSASYGGTGDLLSDTSGNGNHFNLGRTATVDGDEPAFHGTPGGLSENEYFTLGSGLYITAAGGTYDDGWSKNNGVFTAGAVIYFPGSNQTGFFGNTDGSRHNGIYLTAMGGGSTFRFYYDIADAAGNTIVNAVGTGTVGTPTLGIAAMDEATTTLKLKRNVTALETFVTTASALTTNPNKLALGSLDGTEDAPASTRFYMAFASSRLWADAEINNFATALKAARFPSMP